MKDINSLMKLKVLQDLKNHMDSRIGNRLKPKKVTVESVSVEPKDPNASVDPTLAHDTLMKPDSDIDSSGAPPAMPEDDTKRLMDLYSRLK